MFRLQRGRKFCGRCYSRDVICSIYSSQHVSIKVVEMINAFRHRGHFAAILDPLRKVRVASWLPNKEEDYPDVVAVLKNYPKTIDLYPFQLHNVDPDTVLDFSDIEIYERFHGLTLQDIVDCLVKSYCSSVGIEFTHIENVKQRRWLESKIENELGPRNWSSCDTNDEKMHILQSLVRCDTMGNFLTKRFPSSKVFGIEGCESLLPGLDGVLEAASVYGLESVEVGMAHRGRMNVLVNFFKKPIMSICNNFNESEPSELGDVKYHLGTRSAVKVKGLDGITREIKLSLSANPSHLEAVNPVVIGKTKAKQFYVNDTTKRRVMPLLLHGDAAFSGQGIVPEVLELSNLDDYTVGGCVHIIINNQIGFTTDPRLARTSYHCTSVAKGVGAPIFHVNGDDVEAVVSVCRLAAEWRQTFRRDCIVDIVCYRRHGHNSLDDPSLTQPLVYDLIKEHPTPLHIYATKLINTSPHLVRDMRVIDAMKESVSQEFEKEFESAKSYKPDPLEWLASNWQGEAVGSLLSGRPYNQTGVRYKTLMQVGRSLVRVPDDFVLHKDIEKLITSRRKILETGEGVTMAFAESLAFGCLMAKFQPNYTHNWTTSSAQLEIEMQAHPTVHVRLSGQDCIRGTFSQRHASIICQKTNRQYWQLNHLEVPEQAFISVCNSTLSEAAILGFEYGYSLSNDNALTIWEAQFGDFANVAQHLIDNFIVSGEFKWANKSSLVMLLPHGYDGQGPEHSSARLERFLQLVDDDSDSIPGKSTYSETDIEAGFRALTSLNSQNNLTKETNISNNITNIQDKNNESIINQHTQPSIESIDTTSTTTPTELYANNNSLKSTVTISKEVFARAVKRYSPSVTANITNERIDLSLAEIISEHDQLQTPFNNPSTISADSSTNTSSTENTPKSLIKEIEINKYSKNSNINSINNNNNNNNNMNESKSSDKLELTREGWQRLMVSWLQSNSERHHNLIVVVPSTPAQYFHVLRRQIHRPFAKPLVVMSAKWLLHHKPCTSHIDDMTEGTFFQRLILEGGRGDNMTIKSSRNLSNGERLFDNKESSYKLVLPHLIRKVVFCSGAIFYHLYHARTAAKINDITFIRLEQIAPFPYDLVGPAMNKYPTADLIWAQEEPKNCGAWSYVKQRFDTVSRDEGIASGSFRLIRYIGRRPCASPATGGYKVHAREQKEVTDEVLK